MGRLWGVYAVSDIIDFITSYIKDSEVNANILFKINGIKHKLEVTIPLKNFTLRVEEVGDDFYAIVDTSVDKLERQIRKNKTRLENKQMKSKVDFDFINFEDKEDENDNKIVNFHIIMEIFLLYFDRIYFIHFCKNMQQFFADFFCFLKVLVF